MAGYTKREDRLAEPKHPTLGVSLRRKTTSYKWPDVLSFFWLLYISAAEILPTKMVMPSEIFKTGSKSVVMEDDFEDRYVSSFMQNLELQCDPMKAAHVGPGSFQGPQRYLEWSTPSDLYLQYAAISESEGKTPAGFTTFMRTYRGVMGKHLKFRGKNEHAQCSVCFHLRLKIKKTTGAAPKKEATRNYTRHLLSQWLDRQCYWSSRQLSRTFFTSSLVTNISWQSSLCCCIIDGMDQSKLRLPKWGRQRISKNQELLFRPTTHLAACWIHGYKTYIAIADENTKKDSETQSEIIMRSLSDLHSNHSTMPLGLHTQADNCFREQKNQYIFKMNLLLVAIGVFRYTIMSFLRTAHSHEDIDQLFGQVARLFGGKTFDCPSDMIKLLNRVSRNAESSGTSNARLSSAVAYKLDQVSRWKEFGAQTAVSIHGMRRVHYFRICHRADIGAETLSRVSQVEDFNVGRVQPHANDLFLVTKRWMHDTSVSRVIAVMTASTAAKLRQGFSAPSGLAGRRAIGVKVRQNIMTRVPKLRQAGELSEQAANYLLSWAAGTLHQHAKPASYSILSYRHDPSLRSEARNPGTWVTPARNKRLDVFLPKLTEGDDASSDDSNDEDNAPVDFPPDSGP